MLYEPIDDFDRDCRSCKHLSLSPTSNRCKDCVHNFGNINDTDKYEKNDTQSHKIINNN